MSRKLETIKKPYINDMRAFASIAANHGFSIINNECVKTMFWGIDRDTKIKIDIETGLIKAEMCFDGVLLKLSKDDIMWLLRDIDWLVVWR